MKKIWNYFLTTLKNLYNKLSNINRFLSKDIWLIALKKQPPFEAFIYRQIRIFLLAFKQFAKDRCTMRASGLTLFSLLSIVPVLAMIFGISKGFGLEAYVEKQLINVLEGHEEILKQSLNFAESMLDSAKGGTIIGIGLVVLLYSVISLFINIEATMNDIWEIKKSRPFIRKFTDYLTIMLLAPIILTTSSSLNVFLSSQFQLLADNASWIKAISPILLKLFGLIPYTLIWLLLTFFYMIMPNTKVNFRSAFISGIIAGTAYQLTQFLYIRFQIGVSNYNAIYGSLAALPLFLAWLQISWIIILLGAEMAHAHQTIDKYEFQNDTAHLSTNLRRSLAVWITYLIVKSFENGDPPLNAHQIAKKLKAPYFLTHKLIQELILAKIVCETKADSNKEPGLLPALDINKISLNYVLNKLNSRGLDDIPLSDSPEHDLIFAFVQHTNSLATNSDKNILLKSIDIENNALEVKPA